MHYIQSQTESAQESKKLWLIKTISLRLRTILRANKYRTRFEKEELRALFEFMPIGWTSIDIWAYKGAWTYWMSQVAWKNWKVIAFEPQKEGAHLLRQTQSLFPSWDNVRVENSAVGAVNGLSQMYRSIDTHWISQGANMIGGTGQTLAWMVTIQTLDRYTREHHLIGSIDFIKIDAEGCELSIIHGARETISRDKPVIVVECDGNFIGEQKQKTFFATMAELGYDGFFFTENGRKPIEAFDLSKHQRQDLPRWLSDPAYYNNFLFIPQK